VRVPSPPFNATTTATLLLCNFATLQTLQLCNFATPLQLCNFANLQICNFANLQLCKFAKINSARKSLWGPTVGHQIVSTPIPENTVFDNFLTITRLKTMKNTAKRIACDTRISNIHIYTVSSISRFYDTTYYNVKRSNTFEMSLYDVL